MASSSKDLRRALRDAGFSPSAIDAVWPQWWTEDAEGSLSATTELRYTVARRLGLWPRSLFDGPPEFVWDEGAKFKNLGTETETERIILCAFGAAVARHAIKAAPKRNGHPVWAAKDLRQAMRSSSDMVTLRNLLDFAWAVGVPVLYLSVFPLQAKRMHAMTVRSRERYAILLGRESRFASQVAYMLAHEIAHIMLQHVSSESLLIELDDPLTTPSGDAEEGDADRFALEILTGQTEPLVLADQEKFTATALAKSAAKYGPEHGIEPGILALCLGHSTGKWKEVFGALKILPPGEMDVRKFVNSIAASQLDLTVLSPDSRDYLITILGLQGEP